MIGVVASDPRFRAAVAELPDRACSTAGAAGAIHVVPHATGVEVAVAAGAAAVVLAEAPATVADVDAALAATAGVPLLIHRPALGAAAGAPEEASAIVVEVTASRAGFDRAVQDAVGWARMLTAAPLEVRARAGARRGATALLAPPDGPPVTVLAGRAEVGGARLDIQVLGPSRLRVTVTDGSVIRVERSDEHGTHVAPTDFEAPERATLRRALASVEVVRASDDARGLAHDIRVANLIADHENH